MIHTVWYSTSLGSSLPCWACLIVHGRKTLKMGMFSAHVQLGHAQREGLELRVLLYRCITKYGSTLYIGIAIGFVFAPYIRKCSFYFHFQVILTFKYFTALNMWKLSIYQMSQSKYLQAELVQYYVTLRDCSCRAPRRSICNPWSLRGKKTAKDAYGLRQTAAIRVIPVALAYIAR